MTLWKHNDLVLILLNIPFPNWASRYVPACLCHRRCVCVCLSLCLCLSVTETKPNKDFNQTSTLAFSHPESNCMHWAAFVAGRLNTFTVRRICSTPPHFPRFFPSRALSCLSIGANPLGIDLFGNAQRWQDSGQGGFADGVFNFWLCAVEMKM